MRRNEFGSRALLGAETATRSREDYWQHKGLLSPFWFIPVYKLHEIMVVTVHADEHVTGMASNVVDIEETQPCWRKQC